MLSVGAVEKLDAECVTRLCSFLSCVLTARARYAEKRQRSIVFQDRHPVYNNTGLVFGLVLMALRTSV